MVFNVFNVCAMLFVIFICLYPFWYVFMVSINDNSYATYIGRYLLPAKATADNYRIVLLTPTLVRGFMVTISRTLVGGIVSVFFSGALGYALSRKEFIGRKVIGRILVVLLYINAGIIPIYLIIRGLHLLDTFWVLILYGMFNGFFILLMKSFFMQIPDGLVEAAKIDGANDTWIYIRIVIPTSKAVFATISLFMMVAYWGDWFTGDVFITNPNLLPIQTILMRIIKNLVANDMLAKAANTVGYTGHSAVESVKMASIILTIVPIICIYPFLQKYFISGLMLGSIKE